MSEALVSRGNDLFVDELFTEALDCYDAALNLAADGRAAGAIHAKRSATFLKLCRVEEALSAAELALSADPESGIAFKQCGLAMWQLGRKAEARGKFIEAKNLGVQGMEKWISQCPTIEQYEKETKKEEVLEDSVKSTLADKMKFAWIQTTSTVTLTFYAKNLKPDSFKVRIETTKVEVEILLADESKYRREFLLFGNVDPDASSYTTNAFKLIITLKKEQALEWDDIIKEAQDTSVKKRTNVLGNCNLYGFQNQLIFCIFN